ncbi:DUF2605 domain-containing protein [Leptolyngbya sp. AN02str]|uniref:DUF2605 domain-containing protein n=1 Tax=Leptolyngbya sp. AN02str TaxID=3423363 RepID=UPI003D31B4C7
MFNPNLPEPELLKTLLEPLLEDFQYWFGRSRSLLENHDIDFLAQEQQIDLLKRVKQAQKEVAAAQALFKATDCQVGVQPSVLVPWHHLVTECWHVAVRYRLNRPI